MQICLGTSCFGWGCAVLDIFSVPQGKCVLLAFRRNGSLILDCALFLSGLLVLVVLVKELDRFLAFVEGG